MPECFKPALSQVRKLTRQIDFDRFRAQAVQVSDLVPNSARADVYVQQRTADSQIEFRTLFQLDATMPFSFIEDFLRNTDNY